MILMRPGEGHLEACPMPALNRRFTTYTLTPDRTAQRRRRNRSGLARADFGALCIAALGHSGVAGYKGCMTQAEFRGRIYGDITETMGATPLVRLNRLPQREGVTAEILAKLEFFNPMSSVKDRIGVSMIDAAEKAGKIKPGVSTIIEPTSGNTGIGLAFVAAARGYKMILTMPDFDVDRAAQDAALPGRPARCSRRATKGITGAIARAEELLKEIPDSFMPQQFQNPANPAVHIRTTAEEIWRDTGGKLDIFVSGVGTGGTVTGVGQALKPRLPGLEDRRRRTRSQPRPVGRQAHAAPHPGHRCGHHPRYPRPQGPRRDLQGVQRSAP